MSVVEEAWKSLRGEDRTEAGWHLRRIHPDAPCEIFAGIHRPNGTPGLIVEVEASQVPSSIRISKSAGFQIETVLLGHSHTGRVRFALSLAHIAYSAVFAVLCTDTADVAASRIDAGSALFAFIGRLQVWQAFMARHGPDGLSEAGMIGLMGELYILADYLAPLIGIERALAAWAGPRGEPNDFSLASGYLEIKTTALQAPDSISISNAAQLDIARGRILLGHLRFRQVPEGATLPELVERIRSKLATEAPSVLPEFTALLLAVGYVEAHRENYVLHLEPDGLQLFEVTEDFPHIALGDLRAGVRDCSYNIDLRACATWAVSGSTLATIVGLAHG
ncbi:hypothetical protein IWQ48_005843 [Labrenzia sp. EL_13]|nr:hypothetical protein [Labrenzia sp. EL_13]